MPFGILVVYRILAIQVRQSEFVIYSTAPVLRAGAFVALMSSHVPLRLVPRSAMSFRKL
jgi:multidrug efflux pump subunit AcrB